MTTSKTIRNFVKFVLWSIYIVLLFYLPNLLQTSRWVSIASAIPIIGKLAYDYFDWVNLLVNKLLLWLFNRHVSWEMKARYRGDFYGEDLVEITNHFRQLEKSVQILQTGDFERTISIQDIGLVIKISVHNFRSEEDEFDKELIISTQRLVAPFRHSTEVINRLMALLTEVPKIFDVSVEGQHFSFSSIFSDNNPYLGLFLRTLKMPSSQKLNVEFREADGTNQGKVLVTKDKVSITTKDLSSLQAFSKKYITLSSLSLSSA